jgi:alpha-glucoside transport system substrate-binding protein
MRNRLLAAGMTVIVAACTGASQSPSPSPETLSPSPAAPSEGSGSQAPSSPAALTDAKTAALNAAGGKQLGGTVTILGVLGGEELERYLTVLDPFEEATGITVEYEGTRDQIAVLQTRVDGGNPPDLVNTPSVGLVLDYGAQGKVVDLFQVLDMPTIGQDYDAGLLDLASVDGKLLGVFGGVNLGFQIWFNPKDYDGSKPPASWDELSAWARQKADTGTTPWCIGQESGPASGWPGANMITDIILRQAGPEAYERWWRGELTWASPEVKKAFETYGAIATDPKMVFGGSAGVLATNFAAAADGLVTDPPTCYLHPQATFIFDIAKGSHPDIVAFEDMDFFSIPDFDPANSGYQQIAGEMMTMFNDTPQSRALVKYFVTPEAQSLLGKAGWLSPNKRVPADSYGPVLAKASEVLTGASSVYHYGNALMPTAMSDAMWKAVLDYVQDPSKLDAILADLDKVRAEAYR